jgi:hypothetical protein
LHQQGKYIDQVLKRFQVKSFPNLQFEERKQQKATELDPKKKEDTVSLSLDSASSDSNSESGRSSIGSISSNNSPLPERLFEKGNSPAVPMNIETRSPYKNIEEKKKMTLPCGTLTPKNASE